MKLSATDEVEIALLLNLLCHDPSNQALLQKARDLVRRLKEEDKVPETLLLEGSHVGELKAG